MMLSLTRTQHCVSALAVSALALALIYLICILPAMALRTSLAGRIEVAQLQYEKYSRAVAQLPKWESGIAALRKAPANDAAFLGGGSQALAAAELQKYLEALIELHQGNLRTTRVMAPKSDGALPVVALQVQVGVEMESLQRILHAIESGQPILLLDNVLIRAREASGKRTRAASANLELQLTATGFIGK
jgi:hypothetical protein